MQRTFGIFPEHVSRTIATQLGHLVSRRCAAKILNLVRDSNLGVARATLSMADDLRSCPVDCSSSGATCVLTTIHDGKVRVAMLMLLLLVLLVLIGMGVGVGVGIVGVDVGIGVGVGVGVGDNVG